MFSAMLILVLLLRTLLGPINAYSTYNVICPVICPYVCTLLSAIV